MPRSYTTQNVPFSNTAGKPCLQRLFQIGLFGLFVALFALQRIHRRLEHLAWAVIPSAGHQPLGELVEPL